MDEFLKLVNERSAAYSQALSDFSEKMTAPESTDADKEAAFQALREAAAEIVALPHFSKFGGN